MFGLNNKILNKMFNLDFIMKLLQSYKLIFTMIKLSSEKHPPMLIVILGTSAHE